jgi:cyanophycin synthetase
MMRAELLAAGVAAEAITLIPDEQAAIAHGLAMAAAGDLLIVFGDDPARCWKQIIYFKSETRGEPHAPVPRAAPVVATVKLEEMLSEGDVLIRDERGVRLSRAGGEGGD